MDADCDPTGPGDPARLVEGYRPGDFLLAGPEHTVLASGAQAVVAETDPDELAAQVTKQLVDTRAPLAVGALPFAGQAHVVIPTAARRAGTVHPYRTTTPTWGSTASSWVEEPPADGYARAVAAAVSALRADDGLRKVVLARTLRLGFDEPVDVARLLPGLAAANPLGYTFATPLPDGGTLVGATPELLLSRSGTQVVSNPLAGSLPRGGDPAADRAAAAALLASAKDQAEHRLVVEAVVEALRPFCRSLYVPAGPSLVSTPTIWHLSTRVVGELADPDVSSLRLAAALHPTPAVCGTPPAAARAAIAELEPFDRGFYSGVVGWCTPSGDGEWVVALRCAEVSGNAMRLFAGAGIMPASRPEAELAETSAKFRTLLQALGL
ncbi:isochorismate synthase [Actinokineospora sp. NBRC 105648]|uniref:isochorismate synthase n=1 Tax=Actinokineospora sp. NBRC 105648 TaxID=3032206 RepID=UPI0024A049FA|nr:isochorismate synthase [Actinokineospora sp. NBRC 105648]GLZ43670.1 isochorismate synthase [Actinokineospora sp. NBRC 105648]